MSTAATAARRAMTSAEAAGADSPGTRLYRRWRALAPRERSTLRAVGWLLGLLAVWLLAVQPAWRTLRAAPAQLAQVETQLQQMQRLADEARGLRGTTPVGAAQAAAALRAATERLGNGARISIQGDRATLTLPVAASSGPAGLAFAGGIPSSNSGVGLGAAGGTYGNPTGANAYGLPRSGAAGSGANGAAASIQPGGEGAANASSSAATGISGDALRGWLSEARSAARARPVELQLMRSGSGFSGTVVVLVGGVSGGGGSGSVP